jgi:transcription antitermination factor NusG
MSLKENESSWFVVYTKPRWEKKVSKTLTEKGIENYCPLNKVMRKWSDRNKIVLEPLFKGYVFVRVNENHKWDIKKVDGILNYVYWLGKPARVKDTEIDTIKMFLREFHDVEVVEKNLEPDTNVIIRQGVLMNYHGVIVEVIGSRARVRIDSMGVQLIAVFEKANLESLDDVL